MPLIPLQAQQFSLAGAGCVIGATTIVLKNMKTIDGVNITMAMLGTEGFITLEPGSGTLEEQIVFTGITQNSNGTATLTGVSNVTFETPFTRTSGTLKTHAGSTIAVLSNTSGFYDEFVTAGENTTFTGVITFTNPNYPRMDTATPPPTIPEQLATKAYVDSVAIAGAPKATDIVYGITKLSVAAVVSTDPIAVGNNDNRVPTQGENDALVGNNIDIAVGTGNKFVTQTGFQHGAENYAVDTGAVNVMVVTLSPVPISYTAGMVIKTKVANTNTTTNPTINVNGLGAKTITKNGTAPLVAGDLLLNEVITLMYDGTVFQLQTPPALTPPLTTVYTNGFDVSRSMGSASGNLVIAHGLGKVPRYVRVTLIYGVSFPGISIGVYNGTTQSVTYGTAVASGGTYNAQNGVILFGQSGSASPNTQTATISVDATNITLAFVKSGVNGGEQLNIMWEANT